MSRPKYVVSTDDAIHATRGQLIEVQGTVLPVHLYYVTLVVFGAISVPVLGLSLLGGSDWSSALMVAGIFGVVTASLVARQLNSDVGLAGLVKAEVAELKHWCHARIDAVNTARATRPGLLRIHRKGPR